MASDERADGRTDIRTDGQTERRLYAHPLGSIKTALGKVIIVEP